MKRYGLIVFLLLLIILSTSISVFFLKKRFAEIDSINKRLRTLQQNHVEKNRFKDTEHLLSRKHLSIFIEELYNMAETNSLKEYEILRQSEKLTTSNSQRVKAPSKLQDLDVYPLRIIIQGEYRDIAEFIRELQNIKYLKKIRSLTMTPDNKYVRVEINLDLFMSGGSDAPQ